MDLFWAILTAIAAFFFAASWITHDRFRNFFAQPHPWMADWWFRINFGVMLLVAIFVIAVN